MLVLMILRIYELRRSDGLRCHDMHTVSSFTEIGSGIQNLLSVRHKHTDSKVTSYTLFYSFTTRKVS
jgi:hypothetical protein